MIPTGPFVRIGREAFSSNRGLYAFQTAVGNPTRAMLIYLAASSAMDWLTLHLQFARISRR